MLSSINFPLDGGVRVAIVGLPNDHAFIGGIWLGMMALNFIFRTWVLPMGAISPGAQIYGTGLDTAIAHLRVSDVNVQLNLENVI